MKFFWLIVSLGVGLLMVLRTRQLVFTVGKFPWAERNIGPGGTYTFYKLLGVLIIIIGMMYATGFFDAVFEGTAGKFFGGLKQSAPPTPVGE